MPQPLSKVYPSSGYSFGPGFIELRPALTSIVATVIAHFSDTELQFSLIYHRLTGMDAEVAFEMLRTTNARHQIVKQVLAAAKHKLAAEELFVFEQAVSDFKTTAKLRDKFAHNLWGISEEHPDVLLMVRPEFYYKSIIATDRAQREGRTPTISELKPSTDEIYVYHKADLLYELAKVNRSHRILYQTVGFLIQFHPEDRVQRLEQLRVTLQFPIRRS